MLSALSKSSRVSFPGWGAIRKWPLIIRSPTHTVCSQTIITGSGFWFQMGIVWSGVSFGWEWSDQRSVPDGNGLIRGQFRMGMVWSEVTFGLGMVWSEITFVWHGLIRGHFRMAPQPGLLSNVSSLKLRLFYT